MLLISSSQSSVAELWARRWADVQRCPPSISVPAAAADTAHRRRSHWRVPRARVAVNVIAAAARWSFPVGGLAGHGGRRRSGVVAPGLGRRSARGASTTRRRRVRPSPMCLSPDEDEGMEDRVCDAGVYDKRPRDKKPLYKAKLRKAFNSFDNDSSVHVFLAHSKEWANAMARRPLSVRVRPSVCLSVNFYIYIYILRKSLLLADKWPYHHQTCTRWTPGKRASRVYSRSRSKITWYAHFFEFVEWATPSLTAWFKYAYTERCHKRYFVRHKQAGNEI